MLTTLYWLSAGGAAVFVSGSWDSGQKLLPLSRRGPAPAVWAVTLLLPPGRYTYRFVVDWAWATDPLQPVAGSPPAHFSRLAPSPSPNQPPEESA